MSPYSTILLALDLSERSIDVALRAQALAAALGARLALLHVIEHTPQDYPADVVPTEGLDKLEIMQRNARAGLTEIAVRLGLEAPPLNVEVGVAAVDITRVAQELHADLIVVGSHERHGLALLAGSVTDKVVHRAGCDVLAVHLPL